jgi:hypothetical protein
MVPQDAQLIYRILDRLCYNLRKLTSCVSLCIDPLFGLLKSMWEYLYARVCALRSVDLSYIWSFERGCHPIGSLQYGLTVDSVYTTWICQCSADYCNYNTGQGEEPQCHRNSVPPYSGAATKYSSRQKLRSVIYLLLAMVVVVFWRFQKLECVKTQHSSVVICFWFRVITSYHINFLCASQQTRWELKIK